MKDNSPLHTLGNIDLLALDKVAFLCSRNCPREVVEKAREWAVLQRDSGRCVISGYHSPIEKEVLRHLLPGRQPIVIVLARGLMASPDPALQVAIDAGRLLLVTRYAESVTHACEDSCFHRNRLMIGLASELVVAYASAGGKLEKLISQCSGWKISFL